MTRMASERMEQALADMKERQRQREAGELAGPSFRDRIVGAAILVPVLIVVGALVVFLGVVVWVSAGAIITLVASLAIVFVIGLAITQMSGK